MRYILYLPARYYSVAESSVSEPRRPHNPRPFAKRTNIGGVKPVLLGWRFNDWQHMDQRLNKLVVLLNTGLKRGGSNNCSGGRKAINLDRQLEGKYRLRQLTRSWQLIKRITSAVCSFRCTLWSLYQPGSRLLFDQYQLPSRCSKLGFFETAVVITVSAWWSMIDESESWLSLIKGSSDFTKAAFKLWRR